VLPFPAGLLSRSRMTEATRTVLTRLGSRCDPRTPVRRFGLGTQQLVEVARALAAESRLLILDEPSATLTGQEVGAGPFYRYASWRARRIAKPVMRASGSLRLSPDLGRFCLKMGSFGKNALRRCGHGSVCVSFVTCVSAYNHWRRRSVPT